MVTKFYEAMLYETIENKKVKCNLCGRRCIIKNNEKGFCLVRKNEEGKLFSTVYGKTISAGVDQIEKKPFFHFNPGSRVLSIATKGCNFRCKFCDNYSISQNWTDIDVFVKPEDVIRTAKKSNCQGISYTYTEPTIFFEYAYEIAKLSRTSRLFNTFVTNGYITPEAIKKITPYLDAIVVDFKGAGDPKFYRKYLSVPSVEPIYEALEEIKNSGIHLEITNLVIPKIGDLLEKIKDLSIWIKNNLGENIPFHLLRFHPDYKMTTTPSTSIEYLEKTFITAKDAGLNYVYIGNVPNHPSENTYCPSCNEELIRRVGILIEKIKLTKNMKCPVCGEKIPIKIKKS